MKEGYFKRSENNKGAILNTDKNGLESYKKAKNKYIKMQNEIDELKEQISKIMEHINGN